MPAVTELTKQHEEIWVDPEYILKRNGRFYVCFKNTRGEIIKYLFHDFEHTKKHPEIYAQYIKKISHQPSRKYFYSVRARLSVIQQFIVYVASDYKLELIRPQNAQSKGTIYI